MIRRGGSKIWIGLGILGYILLSIEISTRTPKCDSNQQRTVLEEGRHKLSLKDSNPLTEETHPIPHSVGIANDNEPDSRRLDKVEIRSARNATKVDLGDYAAEVDNRPVNSERSEESRSYFQVKEEVQTEVIIKHPILPQPGLTPPIVYYIWCGRYWFEFQNYLSMRSVIKYIQPDKIILYYNHIPRIDIKLYNDWLDVIREEFPFITLRKMKIQKFDACDNDLKLRSFAHEVMSKTGGIFVDRTTIFTRTPHELRRHNLVEALTPKGGFMMIRPTHHKAFFQSKLQANENIKVKCGASTLTKYGVVKTIYYSPKLYCLTMPKNLTYIFPKDIWGLDSEFGEIARTIFYGKPDIPVAKPSYETLVPNIAHMVWMGGGEMDYLFYLSVLSVLHIVKVDNLYIHGDKEPTGPLWKKVKHDERIILIYRDLPETIYKSNVELLPHVSDIFRVDIMVKYGGIYVDTDALFVQPIPDSLRAYDVVASYDWIDWNAPCPDNINFGVTLGKRNAEFWVLFQKSMSYWRENSWSFNGLRQPYRVMERHPDLFHLDPHLQVICFNFLCHPTWWKDYHNESIHHENTPLDWQHETYAFHWTAPVPLELQDEKHLMKSDSMFAKIGKHVLKHAGLLNDNNIRTDPVTCRSL
ncbi:unnamed protein product [Owenia fusiformis]|uniref:Uncharacterized protein n=1 Tax=Owenia fusiformis TaxID=6347 RepID=A0A8J1YAC5_OWEFU|nr:unnamed protein product [Owenia fusiformis]